jgi:anti-sigma regulatory factor (Ser/Thr protein kinase)
MTSPRPQDGPTRDVAPAVRRVTLVGHDPLFEDLRDSPRLAGCDLEDCGGGIEVLRALWQRDCGVLVTNPATPVSEDLALAVEARRIRPGVRTIVLAPEATPDDIIGALRAHVFACFTPPFDTDDIADMIASAIETPDWRDGIEVVSGLRDWLTLRVSCRMVTAERLVRFMTEYRTDLPATERDALIMAFREMLLNAMEHGAGFDPEQVVEVTATRTERAIVYHLKDPGPGFDRATLRHAAVSNAPDDPVGHVRQRAQKGMRPGGFGMLIAKQVVDELVYNERGNEVILIKRTA